MASYVIGMKRIATLSQIDREWLRLHLDTFRGRKYLVRVVRITIQVPVATSERIAVSLPNAHGQYRPAEQWDVECEAMEDVEQTVRVQIRLWPKTPKNPSIKRHTSFIRLAA